MPTTIHSPFNSNHFLPTFKILFISLRWLLHYLIGLKLFWKYILVLPFSLIGLCTVAQYKSPVILNDPEYDVGKRLRFGFSLGINTMDFTTRNGQEVEVSEDGETTQYFVDITHLIPGFNVNAVSDFRLTENFHLRFLPGYAFGQRDLNFFYPRDSLKKKLKIESSFIDLPLSIKYCAQRTNNVRPYLIAGGNFRIDLAAYKKLNPDEDILLRLIKGDVYWEVGFGIDFFLTYFKFSTEIKWSVGMFNVLSNDYAMGAENYVKAVDRINSQVFILAFHFE